MTTVAPARMWPAGETWGLASGGTTIFLVETVGLRYLATLLAEPGREFHCLDLAALQAGGADPSSAPTEVADHLSMSSGEGFAALDETAKAAYRRRLADLEAEREEAEGFGDTERAARAAEEREAIVAELARAVGLGGRDRQEGSQAERARQSVTRAIRRAVAKLRDEAPALADRLSLGLRTGMYCSYQPDGDPAIIVTDGPEITEVGAADPAHPGATRELPTGTVTFLFTDIEGSTRLLRALGDAFDEMLGAHHRIIRSAIDEHRGTEVRTEGDAFVVAFTSAADAVRAAIAMQAGLAAHPWPDGFPMRVRMGLHTGTAEPVDGEYRGAFAIHQAARIVEAANGGQILISRTTRALASDSDLGGAEMVDLGEHRLKDIDVPVSLHAVRHGSFPDDERPLRTTNVLPNNLPALPTATFGRDSDTAEVTSLLNEHRLVTLTGAGGSGKTRLAIELATATLAQYPDGAWFIDLAPVGGPTQIPDAFVAALGLGEPQGDALAYVRMALATRDALLVIDNCEHVIEAIAGIVDDMRMHAPKVRVLATSREPLGISGEVTWRVPSLEVDDGHGAAVELFIDRARLANPSYEPSPAERATIGKICERLDGIPLAIELAASRIKTLAPQQILDRLADQFRLLTGGARTTVERHRTLRATIEWSIEMLSASERAVFEKLSVFRGGFTLEAAEAVCVGDGVEDWEVLDLLGRLVDRSIVISESRGGSTRYRMLEMLRQFGEESLDARRSAQARDAHLAWFTAFAEEHTESFRLFEVSDEVRRAHEAEDDNLRAAAAWAASGEDVEALIRLGIAAAPYWNAAGAHAFVSDLLHEALGRGADIDDRLFARAALETVIRLDTLAERSQWVEPGLAAAERAGDLESMHNLEVVSAVLEALPVAMAALAHEPHAIAAVQAALQRIDRAITGLRSTNDRAGLASALQWRDPLARTLDPGMDLRPSYREICELMPGRPEAWAAVGEALLAEGDLFAAEDHLERSLELATTQRDPESTLRAFSALSGLEVTRGQLDAALELHERARAIAREHGLVGGQIRALIDGLSVNLWHGREEQVVAGLREIADPVDIVLPGTAQVLEILARSIEDPSDPALADDVLAVPRGFSFASQIAGVHPRPDVIAAGIDFERERLSLRNVFDRRDAALALTRLEQLAGDPDAARTMGRIALAGWSLARSPVYLADLAAVVGWVVAEGGAVEDGLRLRGFADEVIRSRGLVWHSYERPGLARELVSMRAAADAPARASEVLAEGAAMSEAEAIDLMDTLLPPIAGVESDATG